MPISPSEAFGLALREARLKRGLSQEDAAALGGIDRAHYGRIERASKAPTITTIWRVSEVVGRKPSQLLVRAEAILEEFGGDL
jgi:transcriptional regulator with XRE-family HTH domain